LQQLQGTREWILRVGDDEALRGISSKRLGEKGYLVFEAATAKETLDIFEREMGKIHLVFSDVVLPRWNGSAVG